MESDQRSSPWSLMDVCWLRKGNKNYFLCKFRVKAANAGCEISQLIKKNCLIICEKSAELELNAASTHFAPLLPFVPSFSSGISVELELVASDVGGLEFGEINWALGKQRATDLDKFVDFSMMMNSVMSLGWNDKLWLNATQKSIFVNIYRSKLTWNCVDCKVDRQVLTLFHAYQETMPAKHSANSSHEMPGDKSSQRIPQRA